MMKYLVITDIPAPWREKVYENIYKKYGNEFHVVYCNYNEKRRLWNFPLGSHPKTFLKTITYDKKGGKENYFNLGIILFLLKNRPRIVVCFSLNPTIFLSFFVLKLLKSKIVVFADTWLGRDKNITWAQKMARKLAYGVIPDAWLGASKQTLNMYKYYNKNVSDDCLFLSALCADNEYFRKYIEGKNIKKKYDIMFSGRITDSKNPLFFADVVSKVKEKRGSCSALVIGDGDEKLKDEMFKMLDENGIDYHFPGFIEHRKLPEYYSQSKILLFPTAGDCWGVIVNEAFVSGVPVITTNMTAAAGELVLDGKNGYILDMDSDLWAEKIAELLDDTQKLDQFSKCSKKTVRGFNFEKAAQGIIDAIEFLKRD